MLRGKLQQRPCHFGRTMPRRSAWKRAGRRKSRLRQSPWHATCITRIDHGYGQPSSKWLSGRLPPPFFYVCNPAPSGVHIGEPHRFAPRAGRGHGPLLQMGYAQICTIMVHNVHDPDAVPPFSLLSDPHQGMEHLPAPQGTHRLGEKPPRACGRSLAQDVLMLITRMTKDALRPAQVQVVCNGCRAAPGRAIEAASRTYCAPSWSNGRYASPGPGHVDWPVIGKQRHCRKE